MIDKDPEWLHSTAPNLMRLFYFTGPTHLTENLRENKIKLSSFKQCNDTFELASYSVRTRDGRVKHNNWKEDCNKEVGIICLSRSWQNPAMWGHYADKGAGVCLVIDVPENLCNPVAYRSTRKRILGDLNFPTFASNESAFREMCSVKSLHWAYEEEVRVFSALQDSICKGGFHFKKFDEQFKLIGAINGYNPQHDAETICDLLLEPKNFFQCRPAFQRFETVVQRNENLWKRKEKRGKI